MPQKSSFAFYVVCTILKLTPLLLVLIPIRNREHSGSGLQAVHSAQQKSNHISFACRAINFVCVKMFKATAISTWRSLVTFLFLFPFSFFRIFVFLFYMYECFAYVHAGVSHAWYLLRPEEGIGFLATRVTDSCEQLCERWKSFVIKFINFSGTQLPPIEWVQIRAYRIQ